MKKLFACADAYLASRDWKMVAVLKFCLLALGVMLGIAVPARKKKASAWAASLVFLAAYVPLMTKFLPYLLGGQAAIEDIYGEKQL